MKTEPGMEHNQFLYKRACEADKQDRCAAAAELFQRYVKIDPRNQTARFRLAENLRALGLLTEAERALKAITEVPLTKRWFFQLSWGDIYMARGDFELAQRCFEKATELNPGSTVPWVYLGGCLAKQQKFQEACDVIRKGLKASGDLDEVYLNLGYNLRALKQYSAARDCFLKALEITAKYPPAKEALEDVELCLKIMQDSTG